MGTATLNRAPVSRAATLAFIDKAYCALDVLNNITLTAYRNRCLDMAEAEERLHRRSTFGVERRWGVSIPAAARLFVVKRTAEALLGNRLGIADVIRIQPSALYAASLAVNYRQIIEAAWRDLDVKALAALDYCALV